MLANNISHRRKDLGMTQQQLADRLGWKVRRIESYEQGERVPPLESAMEIADALGATIEEVWYKKGDCT